MALTDLEIKQWIENYVTTNPGYDWGEWNGHTFGRGLHHKFDVQLYSLQDMYTEKFKRLYLRYKELREGFQQGISDSFIQTTSEDAINDLKSIKDKGWRLADKFRTLNAEIAGREAGQFGPGLLFDREYRGTEYYIDLTDGTDAAPHTGLKYGNYTADVGTDAVTLIETSELGRTLDDDWNGAWIWNVTRGAGAKITASAYAAGTWTLTHASISGQVSGDTYYILDAWLTIGQYTTITGRSVGDKAYVRANTTQTFAVDLNHDEDGDEDDYIHVIGCDSITNDSWGDASDVKPIIDFNNTANYVLFSGDYFWKYTRMVIKNSTDAYGPCYTSGSFGVFLESCDILDSLGSGINCREGEVYAKNCTVVDVVSAIVTGRGGHIILEGCDIDRDDGTMEMGLCAYGLGTIVAIDCTIGATNSPTDNDIRLLPSGKVFLRNTTYDDANLSVPEHANIYSEDDNGVLGAHVHHQGAGITKKTTATVRSGGGSSSIEMTPNANCGANLPLKASGYWHVLQHWPDATWKIWTAATLTTITIYIRAKGTWGTYPVASELYIEASYISDSGAGGDRTKVVSNDVLSHASDWKAFDVTFTPLQAGFVYLNVFLKKYEDAGDGCYVSIEPPEIT